MTSSADLIGVGWAGLGYLGAWALVGLSGWLVGWLVGCWPAGGLAGLCMCTFFAKVFVDIFTKLHALRADRIFGRMSHQKNAQKEVLFYIVQRWVG